MAPIELEGELKEEEYDTENVTVQIVELSTDELAKSNNWIGPNKPIYSENGHDAENNNKSSDEDEAVEDEEDVVPGFTVTETKSERKVKDKSPVKHVKKIIKDKNLEELKTKRGVGQFLAKKTQNKLRQSKAFRTKEKLQRVKNKKKSRIEREKKDKAQKKTGKFKKDASKTQKIKKKFGRK